MSTIVTDAVTALSGNLALLPEGSGVVTIDGLTYPAADGSASQLMQTNGSGVLSFVDAPAGGLEFVETIAASTSSTITFTHTVVAGYDYIITARDVNNSQDLATSTVTKIQVATGAGPTFQTADYTHQLAYAQGTTVAALRDMHTTGIVWSADNPGGAGGVGELWSGEMTLFNPGANEITDGVGFWFGDRSNDLVSLSMCGGRSNVAEVVTALRVLNGAGTILTGQFTLFRRKTTA